ncbi:hypothetical protein ACFQ3Z_44655 [Streptomyces nogalater]
MDQDARGQQGRVQQATAKTYASTLQTAATEPRGAGRRADIAPGRRTAVDIDNADQTRPMHLQTIARIP